VNGEIMQANLDGTGVTTLVPAAGVDPESPPPDRNGPRLA
jgi:hypothetical protein